MASIKVKYRQSSVRDREGTLFYQIIHMRQVRQIYTGIHIKETEWNGSDVIIPTDCEPNRSAYLHSVREKVKSEQSRLESIEADYEECGKEYSADDIVSAYNNRDTVTGFVSFARNLIEEMRKIGKRSAVRRFSVTMASFNRYTNNKEIRWRDFNSALLIGYEEYLLKRGLCRNTTSYYMRNLRSIANRALENDYDLPRNPFKYVYMGVDKTVKRAVSMRVICRIRDFDLKAWPALDFARNVFMFSFYTRGMSFVDIAFLKKRDVQNDIITYRRRKTRQIIRVKIEAQTRRIMENLGESPSEYLLPIILNDNDDAEQQYQNAYHRVNRNLKRFGEMMGLDTRLTMYVARHAWASIAKSSNIPIAIISEAMGHDSETTTRIYLSTLDTSSVDRANSRIIKLMKTE